MAKEGLSFTTRFILGTVLWLTLLSIISILEFHFPLSEAQPVDLLLANMNSGYAARGILT